MSETTWYYVDDVARILGCHRTTVTRACDRGELQSIRIGSSRRITREALAAYLDGETPPPPSALLLAEDYSTDPPTPNLFADTTTTEPDKGKP